MVSSRWADRIAQRLDLGGEELHRVVAPRRDGLAGHGQAEPHVVRQRVAAGRDQLHLRRRHRHQLLGHHRGVDHAGEQRLVAVEVAAEARVLHVVHADAVLGEDRPPTRSGSEPGAEMPIVLPLSSATLVTLALIISPCSMPGQSQPTILRSAPRRPARIAEPGLDSIESTSPGAAPCGRACRCSSARS